MNTPREPPFFSTQIALANRFYVDLRPPRGAQFAVVCGGCEHSEPDYEIQRATFPYWCIEFVARGRGKLQLDRQEYELAAGTIFVYGPGVSQYIVSDSRQVLVKYFVDFTGARARRLLRRHALPPGFVSQTSAPGEILDLFNELIRNGLRHTPFSSRIAEVVLEHLILKIAETAIPHDSSITVAFSTYRRCREYMEAHWTDIRTMEEAAARCHVDSAYLCRLFRRFDHQSPYRYLMRLRMMRAAQRLQGSNASVKQIADELGFKDPFHFSRVFKGHYGVSPRHFLKLGGRN